MIFACAYGLSTKPAQSAPGRSMSAVYCILPVSLSCPSLRYSAVSNRRGEDMLAGTVNPLPLKACYVQAPRPADAARRRTALHRSLARRFCLASDRPYDLPAAGGGRDGDCRSAQGCYVLE